MTMPQTREQSPVATSSATSPSTKRRRRGGRRKKNSASSDNTPVQGTSEVTTSKTAAPTKGTKRAHSKSADDVSKKRSPKPAAKKKAAKREETSQPSTKKDRRATSARTPSGDSTVASNPSATKGSTTDTLKGIVSVNPRGFGFVSSGTGDDDAFLPPAQMERHRLVDGDVVVVKVRRSEGRQSVTRVVKVERGRTRLFGVLVRSERGTVLRVDPWLSVQEWPVAGLSSKSTIGSLDVIENGTAVVAKISGSKVFVLEIFGSADSPEALWARALERSRVAETTGEGAGRRKSADEAKLAKALTKTKRRDLTQMTTFTIDGPESRDLDDALSVRVEDNGEITLFVHVADVSDKVAVGSALDERARRLGTSVYLPGHVVTMLNENLSFDQCSLLEGVVRDTVTVEMRVNAGGEIVSSSIFASKVKSVAKLTYTEVASYLRGVAGERSADLVRDIEIAHVVATRLGARRAARGGVRMERFEAATVTMRNGVVGVIDADGADIAHDLIEEAMVAANETVAKWLVGRGMRAVFRTHDAPGREAAEALEGLARGLGMTAVLGNEVTPMALTAFERQLKERGPADASVWDALTGKLGRANYQADVDSHFGLASEAYVHFTSPIRRYADLTVHRIVKAELAGVRFSPEELDALCAGLNEANERATKAERVATTLLWLKWMETNRPVGAHTRGRIVRLAKRGALVRLEGVGVSGWVSAPGDGVVRVEADGATLRRGNTTWQLGQALNVVVSKLDFEAGNVEIGLAEATPASRQGRADQ